MKRAVILCKHLTVILIMIFTASCSDKQDRPQSELLLFTIDEYREVVANIDEALRDHTRGVAFQGYPERDSVRIKSSLETARGGILTLAGGGDPYSAYIRLSTSLKTYDEIIILDRDQQRLEIIFNEIERIFNRLSQQQGKSDLREWNLYNYNFSSGIEPEFSTTGSLSTWGYNFLINLPKAAVGGRNGANAWLISRVFDLKQVSRPSFRFDTLLMVDSVDQTLDRIEAIEQVFKVYLIFDPGPFEDFSQYSDLQIKALEEVGDLKRIKYSASDMPLGERFHRKWVPSVDLEPYKDRPFAVAFRFDPPSNGQPQYHMWQIFDFEINGAGESPDNPIKYKKVFSINEERPIGFHIVEKAVGGQSWRLGTHGAKAFMVAERGETTDTWLLTPRYFVGPDMKTLSLSVSQTFNKESFVEKSFEKMQILVSKDYVGGDPDQANWSSFDYSQSLSGLGDSNWNEVFSEGIPLPEAAGQELTFAFRYRSIPADGHTWQLNGFVLEGWGDQVSQLNYNLECLNRDPDEDFIFYKFDLESFVNKDTRTQNISGDPASWKVIQKDTGNCFPKSFFEISGHNPGGAGNFGETRKILPEVDLTQVGSASFRFLHTLNYWNDPTTTVIQISVVGSTDWKTLSLPPEAFVNRRDNYLTPWFLIPDEYLGKKIQFAIKYLSFATPVEQKPNWQFKRLEVKTNE